MSFLHEKIAFLSGGLMSLLGLFGLVDLYFLAILLHPKVFSNGIIVQNEYQNELDDPQVFYGQSHLK